MYTTIGYLALFIWATLASLVSFTGNLPTFEILTIVFFISFFCTSIKLTLYKEWYKAKQSLFIWIVGAAGIFGNEALYFSAFKYAPAAQITIIFSAWPLLVIIFASIFQSEKLGIRYVIACLIGLSGIYLAILYGQHSNVFSSAYIKGYLLAFASASIWSIYSLTAKNFKQKPIEMVGLCCGIGSLLSFFLHLTHETTVIPNLQQSIVLIIMGLTTEGIAYFLWDIGMKKGNYKFLYLTSYGNPIISILLLVILGFTKITIPLALACLLIVFSTLIATKTEF